MKFTREFYIPKGSTKVADKLSDAVAYIYTDRRDRLSAMMFFGKQQKPAWHYSFGAKPERRERSIREAFESRRAWLKRMGDRRAERKAWTPTYKVGDIFGTCWGYEQTNREYFEIIEIRGKFAVLREIAQERIDTAWAQGKCVPLPGKYIGEPIRRLMQEHGIKIDDVRWGSYKPGQEIAGVKVYDPASWTAYH